VLSIRGPAQVTDVVGVVPESRYPPRATSARSKARYIRSLPADVPMAPIAVRPEVVVVLDFGTRFPTALRKPGLVP